MESENAISIDATNTRVVNIRHLRLVYGDFDISTYVKGTGGMANLTVVVEQKNALAEPEKRIGILTTVTFKHPETDEIVLEYTNEIVYEVDYFEKVFSKEGEGINVNMPFLKFMYLITISTTRGLLHEKLAGSPYGKVYLPVIDLEHAYGNE